jgi:hypothetical protein
MKEFLIFITLVIWLIATLALVFSIMGIILLAMIDVTDEWFDFGRDLKDKLLSI